MAELTSAITALFKIWTIEAVVSHHGSLPSKDKLSERMSGKGSSSEFNIQEIISSALVWK